MTIQDILKHLDELEAKVVGEADPTDTLHVIACMKINAYPSLRAEIERLQGEVERLKLDVSAKSIQKKDPGI